MAKKKHDRWAEAQSSGLDALEKSGYRFSAPPTADEAQAPTEPESRPLMSLSRGSVLNDLVTEGVNSAASGMSSIGKFIAPGNSVSKAIDTFVEDSQANFTDAAKQGKQAYEQEMQAAQGVGDEVAATLRYVANNPGMSMAQAVGSFAGPGLAIKGVGLGARALGAGAAGVTRAGLAAGATMGGAMAGGDAAGTAYDLVIKAGGTPEQAEAAARDASVIPGAIGAAGGLVGAERLFAGGGGFAGSAVSRALKTAGVEGLQEGLEEGVTQYEGQRAAMPYDPSINPMRGVGGAATMGAVMGGATGGGISLIAGEPAKAGDPLRALKTGGADPLQRATDAGLELKAKQADVGITEGQFNAAMTAMEGQADSDEKSIKAAGRADKTGFAGQPIPQAPSMAKAMGLTGDVTQEVSAFADRAMLVKESLADPTTRDFIRQNLGDEAFNEAAYYAEQADRPGDIPDKTRENMLALAEAIISRARLTPITQPAGLGSNVGPAPDALGAPQAVPAIGLDTTPTGAFRVDAAGNAAPEVRADVISTRQAQAERDVLGTQARKSSAVPADPAPAQPQAPKALSYDTAQTGVVRVDSQGQARPETRADQINARQSAPARDDTTGQQARKASAVWADPAPKKREIPALGYDTSPTGRMVAGPDGIAAETNAERINRQQARSTQPGDITRPGGQPFKNLTAAKTEQRRSGGAVVEVSGGWVVRPQAETINGDTGKTAPGTAGVVGAGGPDAPAGPQGDGFSPDVRGRTDAGGSGRADSTGVPERNLGSPVAAQPGAARDARGQLTVPQKLTVAFGGKSYPVESIEDAQRKWIDFQNKAGAGVSDVGNGVRITDQDGKFVARISFNGRVWDGEGDSANMIAEAPSATPATTKATEPQRAPAFLRKTLPEMTEDELTQASEFYGADHPRASKVKQEVEKRERKAKFEAKKNPKPEPVDATDKAGPIEKPPIDPMGWSSVKLSGYSMAQLNELYQHLLRNYKNEVIGGGPVENGAATRERLNAEGRKLHAQLQKAMDAAYKREKAEREAVGKNQTEQANEQDAPQTQSAPTQAQPGQEGSDPAGTGTPGDGAKERVPGAGGADVQADGVTGQVVDKRPKARKHPPTVRGSGALAELSKSLGGLSPDLLSDLSEKVERTRTSKAGKVTKYTTWDNPAIPGVGPLFRMGGMADLSEVARVLEESGYLEAGAVENDPVGAKQRAEAIIKAELRQGGSTLLVGDADAIESEMRGRQEAAMDEMSDPWDDFTFTPDDLDEVGFTDASETAKALTERLIAEAEGLSIDTETIREDVARTVGEEASQDEYHAATQEAIRAAITQAQSPAGQGDTSRARAGNQDGRSPAEQAGGAGSQGQRGSGSDQAEGLSLTAPTRADIEAQQDRAQQADALDAKAQTKRESEVGDTTFMTGFTGDGRRDNTADLFAPQADPGAARGDEAGGSRSAPAAQIQDFGEKIGGARKDTARPVGGKGRTKNTDERPAWMRRFEVSQIVKSSRAGEEGRWSIADTRTKDWTGQPKKVGGKTFETREEAESAIPLLAVAQKHRAVPMRQGDATGYEIWRDVSDRKRVKVVDQVFETRDDAMRYMADNAQAIIETNTTFGEADLPRPPSEQRIGKARRTGDVKDSAFTDVFGFRGVEFGNWNNQDERQQLLNDAYDGLLDLAEVMGIPPRAISLNGELALAFGARGHGLSGARAHYEPSKSVINLTKMNGAGTLAHEFFHALDHYFARQDGKASATWVTDKDGTKSFNVSPDTESSMVTSGTRGDRSGMRAEMRQAYAGLMDTIKYKAESYVADTARTEKFVAAVRGEVKQQLDGIRRYLADQTDPRYYKRNNKPASAEQLAEFDSVAERIVAGESLELVLGKNEKARSMASGLRWTNDALNKINDIMKSVRGRQGFSADGGGTLDRLRASMSHYSSRLKMLAEAQEGSEKTRKVPTQFMMDAKELDQGRGTDYWTTPHELGARAFQGFIEDKISERGGQSPFLNYGPENVGIPTPWGYKRPFPAGQERKAINAALENLVSTIQTREDDAGNVGMFSRQPEDESFYRSQVDYEWSPPSVVNRVKQQVESLRTFWKNSPEVVVLASFADAPVEMQKLNDKQVENGAVGEPEGFFYKGKAYLLAPHMKGPEDVRRVLFHETLGHLGLRGVFGDGLNQILDQLWATRRKDVQAKADSYGLDTSKQSARRMAAEEVLAEMAQDRPEIGFVRRAVAIVKQWLRKNLPGFAKMKMSDDEIVANFLLPAQRFIERGRGAEGQQLVPAFSRVDEGMARAYHGTPYRGIEKFSTDKIGTGEGAQAYGWGLYFASKRDVAEHYRKTLAGDVALEDMEWGAFPKPAKGSAADVLAEEFDWNGARLKNRDDGYIDEIAQERGAKKRNIGDLEFYVFGDGSFLAVAGGGWDVGQRGTGQLYEVEVPEDDVMLLWDRPLGKQPELVKRALANELKEIGYLNEGYGDDDLDAAFKTLRKDAGTPLGASKLNGEYIYRFLSLRYGSDRSASKSLLSGGIKGIKYLDGTSRGAGDGSFNYVIFDGDHVDITGASFSRSAAATDLNTKARNAFSDFVGSAGVQMDWLDKSLKTQYAKAERFPEFKRVFDKLQDYIEGVSSFANQAADKAPDILPKLDSFKDLMREGPESLLRHGLSQEDIKALSAPVFEGTLSWTRDANGELVETQDPADAGVVFTDAELREKFGMSKKQIGHYRQFRATVDESLDQVVAADIIKLLGKKAPAGLKAMANTADGRARLREALRQTFASSDDADAKAMWEDQIAPKYDHVESMKAKGYAPLSRFGKFFVHVVNKQTGETAYFSMEETRIMSNRTARDLREEFGAGFDVAQGTMSQESYKLMSDVPVDAMEMFASAIGAEKSEVFQKYIALAKNNRSTLKRLLKRKGRAGYSLDAPRVLASFVTSNARASAAAVNMMDAKELAQGIQAGDVKDEAIKLIEAVSEPQESGAAVRGLMFTNFIGGSIASAVVNMTQPVMMTLPYLSQWGGITKAGKRLVSAASMAVSGKVSDPEISEALKRAESEGIVAPQEIHHLLKQATSSAHINPKVDAAIQKLAFVWSTPFALAESFNRKASFIAAYQTAKDEGIANPYAFAQKAVTETQGLYSAGNKPNAARGTLGATVMTFKQYSIHYLEWLARMAKSGPDGKKAALWALALLVMAAGSDGLPFSEDLNDVIDTVGQSFGYDTNTKRWRHQVTADALGEDAAEVLSRGFSASAGFPVDVSMRMGMGNLLPATDMLKKSNTDTARSLSELAGPGGALFTQYSDAIKLMLSGEAGAAAMKMTPNALQNLGKAAKMLETGEYRDSKDRKVMDVDGVDAAMKALSFQPAQIARESAKMSENRQSEMLAKAVEGEITDAWARAMVDGDTQAQEVARQRLLDWNKKNPEMPIKVNRAQIATKAKKMRQSRAERYIKTVAPERRQAATKEVAS